MKRLILFFFLANCLMNLALAEGPVIFITRHAERATAPTPTATRSFDLGLVAAKAAHDSDLSTAGYARAQMLAAMLKDANITAIYATEHKRTQETAEPLARSIGLHTTIIPAKETASLIAKLKKAEGNVLVVGHSNTVPEIISALGINARLTDCGVRL
jgi:broad specificity phosphatase PhoE